MNAKYQEDLRKWVEGPTGADAECEETEEDRRKWTMMQVEQLCQEAEICTLIELEKLCKKKGILIWAVKYYSPQFFNGCIERSRDLAIKDIKEQIGVTWCSLHLLRTLIRQKNKEYSLDKYHGEISCDYIKDNEPDWFNMIFKQRYVTLEDSIEKDENPPRYRRVLETG